MIELRWVIPSTGTEPPRLQWRTFNQSIGVWSFWNDVPTFVEAPPTAGAEHE